MAKKILILGGANLHCKLVSAAKDLGYYTIVTDNLENSPAKKIADEAWLLDVMDTRSIVDKCIAENVAGVISGWLDPCQRPYAEVCESLGLPCYATKEQVYRMTDKHAFKDMCMECGVDVIPEYTMEEVEEERVTYPVFVKPVDSRGSRGQAICYNKTEVKAARKIAAAESSNGNVIIEKYIGNTNSFQVTYFFIDGKPYLIRTADGYKGLLEEKLDKVALCSISPSVYTGHYLQTANEKVTRMLQKLGIRNGPAMLQGFCDNGIYRFYDPGLRFPGVEYDLVFKEIYGIDVMKMMVEFAMTGKIAPQEIADMSVFLQGKVAAVLFPTISAGTIARIEGFEELADIPSVVAVTCRHSVGDTVAWTYNVSQRLGEIDFYADNFQNLIEKIKRIQKTIMVADTEGNDMIYKPFDTTRLVYN